MTVNKIISQSPTPKVIIRDIETGLVLSSGLITKNLQSYQWQLSTNDITGSFSLTFFPDIKNNESLFDKIKIFSIVEIYERAAETNIESSKDFDRAKPIFTGVIKNKKYVTQANDSGGARRLSVSGTAITGLVSQFYLCLDSTACAITKKFANEEDIRKKLTINLNTDPNKDTKKIKDVINIIWEAFCNLSSQYGTLKVKEYIERIMGKDFFICDDKLSFYYPLGCVFSGNSTQDFFSIIENIIPSPVYEKFAFVDSNGKMRIRIREVPYTNEDWQGLKNTKLKATQIKSIDLEESINEIYTVFYAYLNGYPMEDEKILKLYTATEKIEPNLIVNEKKFSIYGYKPLLVHFIGYGAKDGVQDSSTQGNLKKVIEKIKGWYENVEEMLKGSVTLAMEYQNDFIMPGEKVSLLGGEFYVEGVSHSWNYGSGGDINLSLSRGGVYNESGEWSKLESFTSRFALLKSGEDSKK